MQIEPGIYQGVSFDDYRQWEAVNNTLLRILQTHSPLHAKTYQEQPPEPTDAFIVGHASHTLALEPDKFKKRYAVAPVCDKRTKAGKAEYEAFAAKVNGRQILTTEQYRQAMAVSDGIKGQRIYRFIQQGQAEVCIAWTDKETGLLCKARIDYVHAAHNILIDLKSTIDASPAEFQRAIWNYGYYQQAAFYSDGWQTLSGGEVAFVFLPVEKNPPYAVAAYEVHENTIQAGRNAYRQALNIYAECLANDNWPGYADSVEMINLPKWALEKSGVSKYQVQEI